MSTPANKPRSNLPTPPSPSPVAWTVEHSGGLYSVWNFTAPAYKNAFPQTVAKSVVIAPYDIVTGRWKDGSGYTEVWQLKPAGYVRIA